MTTLAPSAMAPRHNRLVMWLSRAEDWLDARGRGAWIAAMVLAFIVVWPVGLALLFYMIWSNKMNCSKSGHARLGRRSVTHRSSGNSAFDAYRDETLRRLQDEQENFEAFLDRLRQAKDKSEFDQFMDDRARKARDDMAPQEA
ncbi:DUF2852 domain-containing protein [Pseudohalocynthiibacter aestuariivivens]|uniref:DUF2852 domain-containing protein n=1 Tax=Roseovarius pelagicus TaxID=2980108 RepID=A0ABY6DHQ4_9RHOB|nr:MULTISPECIES: DUF2852 domain-containing protein [Rhodobacterales]QIE44743.1 DUF2852 domain-containing protein [Pseudohalocynthiibacter aestuariivivens]UXX83345.1 DUF2852 domain-containing protein [Roseovarius pelagicus]